MIISFSRHRLLHCLGLLTCLLVLFAGRAAVSACSFDYGIWIPRSKSADALFRFIQKDKAGYIDASGRVILKPQFKFYGNSGDEFEDGLLQLSFSEARYVDRTGKLVINKDYESAWDFSEGLAAAMPKGATKWGYIDRTGEFVISPRFETGPRDYVYSFADGLAMIEVAGKYGYIDRTGEFVIKPTFVFGREFHEGLARVVLSGPCTYHGDGPCPDFRVLGEKGTGPGGACQFSFVDKTGKPISELKFDYARDFSEGLAAVQIGAKWGYVDRQGLVQITPAFDDAEPFSEGLARIRQGELYGFIDRTGKTVIKPQFKLAEDFANGRAVVARWDEENSYYTDYHYIDKVGRKAIAQDFFIASSFFKGLAHVRLKAKAAKDTDDDEETGTFAYINVTGRKVFIYQRSSESAISIPARSNVMELPWMVSTR